MSERFAAVVEKVEKLVDDYHPHSASPQGYHARYELAASLLPDITAMHEALNESKTDLEKNRRCGFDLLSENNELKSQLAAKDAEITRLNQMLRDTGYGQGQIDAYAAQCEEIERLRKHAELIIDFAQCRIEGIEDIEGHSLNSEESFNCREIIADFGGYDAEFEGDDDHE